MKIVLKDEYKSLKPFESDSLHDLTIITGKNGSGKSQLLDVIGGVYNNDPRTGAIGLTIEPPVSIVQVEGIIRENLSIVDLASHRRIIDRHIQYFNGMPDVVKLWAECIISHIPDFVPKNGYDETMLLIPGEEYFNALKSVVNGTFYPDPSVNPFLEHEVLQKHFPIDMLRSFLVLKEVRRLRGKSLVNLEPNDFYLAGLDDHFIDTGDLFKSQIETLFYNYAKRRLENEEKFFRKERYNKQNNAIPDTEFIRNFPPPWEVINLILMENGILFAFEGIETEDFQPENNLQVRLLKLPMKLPVAFSDLSSGEKTIIGLILKVFASAYYSEKLVMPELVILDEPDAFLHPEMSKLLIDVIQKSFVEKHGIKVIMTTHSPSTVALAPEESLFQLNNFPETMLTKVSKDDALKILTSFLPTLTIDYNNHRQVFVESPTDVFYYQELYYRHKREKEMTFELYFMSNAMGKGSCDTVYQVVNDIRKSGNSTSFGIVDWDLKNQGTDFVLVHGMGERYSVENFVFDPIYIISLLLKMNNAHGIASLVGLSPLENEFNIGLKPVAEVQALIDVFFMKVRARFPTLFDSKELNDIRYKSGHVLQWPKVFCETQGHQLEQCFKEVFPALNKYTNEGEIQKELTKIAVKSYPFISQSSIELLEQLGLPQKPKKGGEGKGFVTE